MKFKYYVLSEEVFTEAYSRMSEEEFEYMESIIREASAIVKFRDYSDRLLFEAAMRKGFLSHNLERVG